MNGARKGLGVKRAVTLVVDLSGTRGSEGATRGGPNVPRSRPRT
jgi:hypothetical protein